MMQTLAQLATILGAKLVGDGNLSIHRLATFDQANEGEITFVSDKKLLSKLEQCQASAIVLPTAIMGNYQGNALFMDNPYVGYAMLANIFDTTPNLNINIAESAIIDSSAIIGKNVAISENVVIGAGVEVADNCQIFANVVLGEHVKISAQSKIYPNVTVYHGCEIGQRCIIHANTVIGSDGFGNAPHQGKWVKIPQIGKVLIGDDVEIGSSTTIDRGALSDTIISNGVKIDNQCQIAHNVFIGEHTAVAGGSNIAGSTKVGKSCIVGGSVAMNGHLNITDNVVITGDSMVMRDISEPGIYSSGVPAIANKQWRKNTAYTLKIDDLFKRVKQLEKQLQDKD
ncbi:UDP-3-O-(3-hydroxymyristoyl)glucosamine N-acyltransferase [Psychromonas sp. psych-6C06]|uniref:UDP-3-O-(3-hydroxymyristoyl)glucosamine N-acyltransferase n=1 Tax=Psychromonas sp. psych-6C06 TaxID=2058089 RepID=UPI000C34543F|nr:UDP-3-O-(3-hydroxymyristoyl)glucosamine N-acyltransferase [Psychromonas sp. psych-6C06]PKF62872.1 UDP-3-O-(3-hydroxymyristoyl)glucosamine N-acyltransferase [Psychromonas sp. psych-6C06]